ncbi:PREDICTED: spermatogenesis-defective protein 39 homolog [Ceratosolen solmsi marchali]|uniref:Spermatogenesis-defective protein 39 homolog n=1 Tax=Ceratosolen solmsi marchali TaxID=326594 RepID=A0AAJ6YWI8_9HYME|nr:PREDICTED: spermatogenesis-defective protein 39 homolog [Ceratosolen solmsi marchali]
MALASNDDDDFWYSSEKRSFCFESSESDNLFGVSKSGTAQLRAGISNIQVTDNSPKYDEPQWSTKPLLSIISTDALAQVLEADRLQYISDDSFSVHPDATLRNILIGQPYSLEQYKSLSSKTALIDAAIKSGNGNAILGITLFLKRTLKRSVLQKLLFERPEVLHMYIHYLSTRMCISEICDLLTAQGKTTDAAIRCLNIIIKNTDKAEGSIDLLLAKITKHYTMFFSNLSDCRETAFVKSYVKLLEWQKNFHLKLSEPLKCNSSALECLRLTCKDYWGAKVENNSLSPLSLAQSQKISPRQYQKVAIVTRASVQAWDDIDALLHKKGWLGGKKLQTNLPIEEVLKLMQDHRAPSGIMEKFLNYVESTKRLEVAKNLNCYKAVINIFGSQGDRTALLEYKASLRPQSEEYFYAESILCSTSIRWRN